MKKDGKKAGKSRPSQAQEYRDQRLALGLSQEGLARKLGVSLSTATRYEAGRSRIPQPVLELLRCWRAAAGQ